MIAAPTIPRRFEDLARDLFEFIPGRFSGLEVVAAASTRAKDLARDGQPDFSHYREAVKAYVASLPSDPTAAARAIKADAALALELPQLLSDHDELEDARQRLESAEADVQRAESNGARLLQQIRIADLKIHETTAAIERWQIDFDGITEAAEQTIAELFGADPERISGYDSSRLETAFHDLSRIPALKRIAPAALAKLQADLAAHTEAKASLVASGSEKPAQSAKGFRRLGKGEGAAAAT